MKDGLPDSVANADLESDRMIAEEMQAMQQAEQDGSNVAVLEAPQQPAAIKTPAPEPADSTRGIQSDQNATISQLKADLDLERRRNDTLKGIADKQVVGQVKELAGQIAELKAQLTEAKRVPAHLRKLTEEEREALGSDTDLPLETRMALGIAEENQENMLAQINALSSELAAMRENQETSAAKSENDRFTESFFSTVEGEIPGARAVNDSSPQWHVFLDKKVPGNVRGKTYREVCQSYFDNGDTRGFISVMQSFLGSSASGGVDRRVLAQVKPNQAGNVETPHGDEVEWLDNSFVQKFWKVQGEGVYTAEQEAVIEAKIWAASEAGRIRMGR